jgi:hypothetical protein
MLPFLQRFGSLERDVGRANLTVKVSVCALPSSQLTVTQLIEEGYEISIRPGRYFTSRKTGYARRGRQSSKGAQALPGHTGTVRLERLPFFVLLHPQPTSVTIWRLL